MIAKIVVRNAVKLFNDGSGAGLACIGRGESKEGIFRATGATVAVSDVSFEVREGEIFVINEALLLGDRIAIMKDGSFVQVGTAQEIVANPADDYVRAFIADIDRSRVFTAADVAVEPAAVPRDASARGALHAMEAVGREAAHVVEDGRVLGIVTRRDLVKGEPLPRVELAR